MLDAKLGLELVEEVPEAPVSPAPVLITEQQVALGTAVALQAPPRPKHRWLQVRTAFFAAVHRGPAPSKTDTAWAARYYPKRYSFLEDACLARAMHRL